MIGHLTKDTFDPDKNYDDFYAGHKFEPFPEELCLDADTVVPRVGWALDVARDIKAKSVLDLCCLDGFASLTLAAKLPLHAIGIDLSQPGVELAERRAKKFNLDAEFYALPVESALAADSPPFDLVLLFEAAEHFTDVDAVMDVISQHLKPSGTLLVSTPDAEGEYGFGNKDECHLRIYTHRSSDDLPTDTSPITKHKPVVSLPDYLAARGYDIIENNLFNGLIHTRAVRSK